PEGASATEQHALAGRAEPAHHAPCLAVAPAMAHERGPKVGAERLGCNQGAAEGNDGPAHRSRGGGDVGIAVGGDQYVPRYDLALRRRQDGPVAVLPARQNRRMLEDFAAARAYRSGEPACIVQRMDDAG